MEKLLQLSVCVVIVIQLTSSGANAVNHSEEILTQIHSAISQLQSDVDELKAFKRQQTGHFIFHETFRL